MYRVFFHVIYSSISTLNDVFEFKIFKLCEQRPRFSWGPQKCGSRNKAKKGLSTDGLDLNISE